MTPGPTHLRAGRDVFAIAGDFRARSDSPFLGKPDPTP